MGNMDDKPHGGAQEVEAEATFSQVDNAYDLDEKARVVDYKEDAVAAETAEHNMTVLEAVRAYPMASFWAFVMSFTIVTPFLFSIQPVPRGGTTVNTILRLWSPTMSSLSEIS